MMKRYTLTELQSMPTLSTGHMEDLKVYALGNKVWLSRMTKEDGMEADNMVMVERYDDKTGSWRTVDIYPAL